MPRFIPLLLLAIGSVTWAAAQDYDSEPPEITLVGRLSGDTYESPTGAFRIQVPVLPELGGTINDTRNVVTFEDDFNTHVSIAAFPQDATQRWELSTRGRRDYLIHFFREFVMPDFKERFNGTLEAATYLPNVEGGALACYLLLPGGSMFADRVTLLGLNPPAIAKRGNLVFVRNEHIFVISTELAERVLERSTYKKTKEEEDRILQQRLLALLDKIEFPAPPTTTTSQR